MTIAPIDRETIEAVAQLLAQKFDPEQIILFGARGNAGSHSDVDLLVVLKSLGDWPKRDNPIRAAIAEQFILPVDLLVSTPECRTRQRNNPYAFLNTVIQTTTLTAVEALPGFSCPVRDLFEP